ncbi:sodium-independent anion transporter, partial [Ectothiorhodospiraceae bacterium WFHF3C12]|nr:sodium-independent anion transporter [Ectothiorhodospiraceae bacterium WFHF3C12]
MVPVLDWGRRYRRGDLGLDVAAGVITAVLLIPQAMAYAALAGVPPEVGLYASIIPPLIYAAFGTSRTLAVGPVSVAALLVANALADIDAPAGSPEYLAAVMMLAALCGGLMLATGALRLGALVNFISHPVLSGFTSAAAVIIIISQLGALAGIRLPRGESTTGMVEALLTQLGQAHGATLALGLGSVAALLLA